MDGAAAAVDRAFPTGSTLGSTSEIASSDSKIAAPIAVPGLVVKLLMARSNAAAVPRRCDRELGKAREHDETHARAAWLRVDELPRVPMRHAQAVGEQVGGAHRARVVEGENDRGLSDRDVGG